MMFTEKLLPYEIENKGTIVADSLHITDKMLNDGIKAADKRITEPLPSYAIERIERDNRDQLDRNNRAVAMYARGLRKSRKAGDNK